MTETRARNLREIREGKGLSQYDLAQMLGMPRPVISRYEHGKTDIRLKAARKLADALGVTLDELELAMRGGNDGD